MDVLFLLILFALLALGLWLGYLGFNAMSKRNTPAKPAEPPGLHHTPPKSTAEEKARGEA